MQQSLVELFTRSFSLMVRLFGNVMSGVFMIGVVLSLAEPGRKDKLACWCDAKPKATTIK